MIFVTLGSQKFQFNRLLKKLDELVEKRIITDEMFAQIGASDYIPRNYKYKDFLDREQYIAFMEKCDTVVTHGGTGTIIEAVKKSKKVIAVPRLSIYGEHVDDHQLQLLAEFEYQNLILQCRDVEQLGMALKEVRNHKFALYYSNTDTIIRNIEKFLKNWGVCDESVDSL